MQIKFPWRLWARSPMRSNSNWTSTDWSETERPRKTWEQRISRPRVSRISLEAGRQANRLVSTTRWTCRCKWFQPLIFRKANRGERAMPTKSIQVQATTSLSSRNLRSSMTQTSQSWRSPRVASGSSRRRKKFKSRSSATTSPCKI